MLQPGYSEEGLRVCIGIVRRVRRRELLQLRGRVRLERALLLSGLTGRLAVRQPETGGVPEGVYQSPAEKLSIQHHLFDKAA